MKDKQRAKSYTALYRKQHWFAIALKNQIYRRLAHVRERRSRHNKRRGSYHKKYYQEHKEEYSTKGEVHLSTIVLLKKAFESNEALIQRGRDILARLKAGEDFGKLAREFSSGPGAEDGGDLGKFEIAQLDPGLQKIIKTLEKGGLSDLIVRPDGVQIIKLIDRTGGQNQSLDDVRDLIYTLLYQEEINRRYSAWIKELRESSYTKIIF